MIQDVSNTLKRILTMAAGLPPALASAAIVFDPPVDSFAPQKTTVDLFLYDIRENLELRNNESTVSVSNGKAMFVPPPLRVACSYLVTAWPVGGTDLVMQEQQLLAEVLQILSSLPLIPAGFLQGGLVGQEPPLPMVTLHPDSLRAMSEFWTSLGTKLRASLTVTVTFSMNVLPAPAPAPIVVTHEVGIEQQDFTTTHEADFFIGGTVTDVSNLPVVGGEVTIIEREMTAITDSEGRFRIGLLTAGTYTLQVQAGALQTSVSIKVPATVSNGYNVQLT